MVAVCRQPSRLFHAQAVMDMSASKLKINTSVPIFLWKLWVLLNDIRNDVYIRWSQNGDSFVVVDVMNFSKKLLPQYFKHNNFASFVRQLNLYGFRKVIDLQQGILSNLEPEQFEFQHPLFKRGRQELIEQIRRRLGQNNRKMKEQDIQADTTTTATTSCNHVQTVSESHREISSQLSLLRDQNERIWSELIMVREQHDRQSKVLDRLISFFASVFRPYNSGLSNMLVNNILQDGSNSSGSDINTNYNHVLSTLANIASSINDSANYQNNNSVVPVDSSMPNLSVNNNALAALTFNIPPPTSTHEQQNYNNTTLHHDPFYTLTGSDNSFQEFPAAAATSSSSIPANTNTCVFGHTDSKNNSSDSIITTNKQDNTSKFNIPPMPHSHSNNNMLLKQNMDRVAANFGNFTPLLSTLSTGSGSRENNHMYGLSPLMLTTSAAQTNNNPKPPPPMNSKLNISNNKYQTLVDDCREMDQKMTTIGDLLKPQTDDGFSDDTDGDDYE